MNKTRAGKTLDIPSGKLQKVSVEGNEILVVNIGDNYFAMDDTCAHSGASLSNSKLDGSTLTCEWQGTQFDCKTGKLEKFAAKINDLKSHKVVVESDNVLVEV